MVSVVGLMVRVCVSLVVVAVVVWCSVGGVKCLLSVL